MIRRRRALLSLGIVAWCLALGAGAASAASPTAPPPGPPFPSPTAGRAVYDFAGVLSPSAVAGAESTIAAIEARTAAGIVVYTQDSGSYDLTTDGTRAKAAALIDQWGVGRAGFDDGLAIFFDLDPTLRHGQVQLYAGPGFEAAYLSNEERQRIFDNDMLPYLRSADFDGALAIALEKVDAAATPEHAAALQTSRQVNAVVGLVGAPIVLLVLSGWAFFHWRRFGKDPVYLDDPSVLMPAPPPELTAAAGAVVMDGGTSRRALTTAMLDLASRGLVAFRQEQTGLVVHHKKIGIEVAPGAWRRRGRGPAGAERAAADRTRRGARSARPPVDRRQRRGLVHRAGRRREVRREGRRVRPRPGGPRRRPWLVRPEAEQGRDGLGGARRRGHRHRVRRAGRRAVDPGLGPDPDRRRRDRRAGSWSCCSPGACPR